jgi:hypothetical protein
VPKLADAGYTTVFNKAGEAIYNDYTTTILASNPLSMPKDVTTQDYGNSNWTKKPRRPTVPRQQTKPLM